MELDQVVRRRRMCRDFANDPVDPGLVDELLDLARRAPSAGHTQGWAWLVLEGAEATGRFWAADADPAWLAAPSLPGLLNAPVILVPLASPTAYATRYAQPDKSRHSRPGGLTGTPSTAAPASGAASSEKLLAPPDWPVPWWDVDTAFSVMLLLLGAADRGLGALFFALHGEEGGFREAFAIPAGWRPLGAVALGWPAPADAASLRPPRTLRPLDEVVHRGRW